MRWQSTPCPISCSSTRLHGRPSQKDCLVISEQQVQMSVWISISPYIRPVTHETGHVKCGQGPGSCGWLGRVSLLGGEAQLAGCLKEPEGRPMEWDAGTH